MATTIIMTFVGRSIAYRSADNYESNLKGFSKFFIKFFSNFRITTATYYKINSGKVVIDERMGLSIIGGRDNSHLIFNSRLVLNNKKEYSIGGELGYSMYIPINDIEHRIMLVKIDTNTQGYYGVFELRKLSKN